MQYGGSLEDVWLMFDHMKQVQGWMIMACHVYDPTIIFVLTIVVCGM